LSPMAGCPPALGGVKSILDKLRKEEDWRHLIGDSRMDTPFDEDLDRRSPL
jgi:hypothetical protein